MVDGVKTLGNPSACSTGSGTNGPVSCQPAAGVIVSGTYTNSGSTATTAYNLNIEFSDYNDSATGYTLASGTITVAATYDTGTSTLVSLSMSGGPITFTGGSVTTQTWNNIVFSTGGGPANGTVLSNGTLFDARTL